MALVGPDGVTPLSARPQPQTPDEPPAPKRVTTAFIVYVEPSGRVIVTDDLSAAIVPSRNPSLDDILGAAANVQAEIAARKTADMAAQKTVLAQLATAQHMRSQALSPAEQAAVAASAGQVPR